MAEQHRAARSPRLDEPARQAQAIRRLTIDGFPAQVQFGGSTFDDRRRWPGDPARQPMGGAQCPMTESSASSGKPRRCIGDQSPRDSLPAESPWNESARSAEKFSVKLAAGRKPAQAASSRTLVGYRSSGSQLSPIAHADLLGVADRGIRTCVERPSANARGGTDARTAHPILRRGIRTCVERPRQCAGGYRCARSASHFASKNQDLRRNDASRAGCLSDDQ